MEFVHSARKPATVIFILLLLASLILPAAARGQGIQQPDRPIEIRSLAELNSGAADFSPSLSPDGKRMLFNTRNGKYQDIYLAEKQGDEWKIMRNVRELNSDYNDETPYWSEDGRLVLFASDRDGSLEMPADAQGRIRVSYDLYWARAGEDGRFSAPVRIPGTFQTSDHERAPALSNDGKEIYYTSWEFGDITGSRIMVARWNGNGFSEPEPLPESINSGHQEAALMPLKDETFVFSSRRPGGNGGWDFYSTRKNEDGWSQPRLIPEISSSDNEMHLTLHDGVFYFASDRSGGKGHYDLYTTSATINLEDATFAQMAPAAEEQPERTTSGEDRPDSTDDRDERLALREGDAESYTNPTLNRGREEDLEGILQNYDAALDQSFENESPDDYRKRIDRGLELAFEGAELPDTRSKQRDSLIIQDKESGRPLSVQVKMRPYYRSEARKRPDPMLARSDEKGNLPLPSFDSEGLELSISLPGYTPYHRIIDYRAVFAGKRIVYLERARKGESFQVTDIRFDANSAVLRDESESYLESLVEFMEKNPSVRLRIIGHTDLHGSREYNENLSYRRALSVKSYLVYHGIKEERLEIEGAGFSQPIVNKKGEPYDAQNRRTEFLILDDQDS